MNFQANQIHFHFGLGKPVRILQLTDVHISLADERNPDMIEYAAGRRNVFFKEANFPERDPLGYLEDAMEYSKNFDCTVITGDLVDFDTDACYEAAQKILAGKDYMYCAGNHEFTPRPGTDSYALRAEKLPKIQARFRGDLTFESRIVGGVNVIAAENGFVTWTEEQFEKLKFEVSRGLPILMFFHVPIADDMITLDRFIPNLKEKLGADDALIETSRKVMRYLGDEPLIKGFLTGHGHNNGLFQFCGKPCYMVGGLFKGIVGEITVD